MEFLSAGNNGPQSSSDELFTFAVEDIPEEGRDVDEIYIESNSLLKSFGVDFFKYERIQKSSIVSIVEILRSGFEDGLLSDPDVKEVLTFADFSVIKFLLNSILKSLGTNHVLVRCLAFGGNICETIWCDFAHKSAHVLLLMHATEFLLSSSHQLAIFREKPMHRRSYHGFDKRDIKEYNVEGYEDEELELEQRKQAKAEREEQIMTMLLLVTQFFMYPVDLLSVYIENARERKHNNSENEPYHVDPDYELEYITECIITDRLPKIEDFIFDITHALSDDGLHQAMKLLVVFAQQYPNIRFVPSKTPVASSGLDESTLSIQDNDEDQSPHMGNYTELSIKFIRTDRERADGGVLQQTLLYILNENNYPNIQYMETMACLRFIVNILYSVDEDDQAGTNPQETLTSETSSKLPFQEQNDNEILGNRGNFYVNDLKVLMEVCLRELTNVVRHSGERQWDSLRLRYVHVIQGVLERTNWSRAADSSIKEAIKALLEDIEIEEIYAEETRYMAEYTLMKFESLLR